MCTTGQNSRLRNTNSAVAGDPGVIFPMVPLGRGRLAGAPGLGSRPPPGTASSLTSIPRVGQVPVALSMLPTGRQA